MSIPGRTGSSCRGSESRMTKVVPDRSRNFTRRAFLPIVAAWSTLASSASDDEAVWTQYLAWLNGRVLGDLVGLDTYRKVLADQGLPKEEVERRIALIHERSLKRPEAMRLWFNSMYGPHGAVGPDWPTPFLMDVVKGLKPGIALDVCMGEGRNSIFLAGLGWKVTGFDVSDTWFPRKRCAARLHSYPSRSRVGEATAV